MGKKGVNMLEIFPIILIGAVSAFLAYHEDYDDGLFGRTALGIIVLMTVIITIGVVRGAYTYQFSLEMFVFLCGVAAFALRHAWRFLQFHRHKKYAWDGVDRRSRA